MMPQIQFTGTSKCYRYNGVDYVPNTPMHAEKEVADYLIANADFMLVDGADVPDAAPGTPVTPEPDIPVFPANGFRTKDEALAFAAEHLEVALTTIEADPEAEGGEVEVANPVWNKDKSLKSLNNMALALYNDLYDASEDRDDIDPAAGVEELNPKAVKAAKGDKSGAVAV